MSRHLEEQEVTAELAGFELEETVRQHLATCLDCRRRVTGLRRLIEQRRDLLAAAAPDWEVEREALLHRLEDRPPETRRGGWMRAAMAIAAAAVLAVGVGLLWSSRGPGPDRGPTVEQILAEAEALLANESIPGFEAIDPGLDELATAQADERL